MSSINASNTHLKSIIHVFFQAFEHYPGVVGNVLVVLEVVVEDHVLAKLQLVHDDDAVPLAGLRQVPGEDDVPRRLVSGEAMEEVRKGAVLRKKQGGKLYVLSSLPKSS